MKTRYTITATPADGVQMTVERTSEGGTKTVASFDGIDLDAMAGIYQLVCECQNQADDAAYWKQTAQRAANANPACMSCMERDTLLRALDERLKGAHASETDKVNAIKIVHDHAVGMRLTSDPLVLLEAGDIVWVVLTERYQHEDRMFFVEKSTRDIANRLMKFIDAALA